MGNIKQKNVLARKAIKHKRIMDADNQTKVALWRDMMHSSDFTKIITTKVLTGRDAWYDKDLDEIVLGEKLDQEQLFGYEKMVFAKLIPTPKEIVDNGSEKGADALKSILEDIRKESQSKVVNPTLTVDVDIDVAGDVDF